MRKIDGWIYGLDCKDCFDNNAPFYFCLATPLILGVSVCLFVCFLGGLFFSINDVVAVGEGSWSLVGVCFTND